MKTKSAEKQTGVPEGHGTARGPDPGSRSNIIDVGFVGLHCRGGREAVKIVVRRDANGIEGAVFVTGPTMEDAHLNAIDALKKPLKQDGLAEAARRDVAWEECGALAK